jgi:hypothetical protein
MTQTLVTALVMTQELVTVLVMAQTLMTALILEEAIQVEAEVEVEGQAKVISILHPQFLMDFRQTREPNQLS